MTVHRIFLRSPNSRPLTQEEESWVNVFGGTILNAPPGLFLVVDDGAEGRSNGGSFQDPQLLVVPELQDRKLPPDASDWQKAISKLIRQMPRTIALIENEGRLFIAQADGSPWIMTGDVQQKEIRARILARMLPGSDFIRHVSAIAAANLKNDEGGRKAGALRRVGKGALRWSQNRVFWNRIETVGDEVIRPLARRAFSKPTPGRNESFEDAVRRLRLDGEELAKRYKQFVFATYMYLCFAVLCIVSVVAAFRMGFPGIILLAGPAGMAMFCALAFQYSFRAWQVKNRRLGGLKDFLSAYDDWLPR